MTLHRGKEWDRQDRSLVFNGQSIMILHWGKEQDRQIIGFKWPVNHGITSRQRTQGTADHSRSR